MPGRRGRKTPASERARALRAIAEAVSSGTGLGAACADAGVSVRTHWRWKASCGGEDGRQAAAARRAEGMRLGAEVRAEVLRVCGLPEYADLPPGQIVADLVDREDRYLCSVSSMYRILREACLVRRRDRTRAPRPRPRGLCARGPREVWVWDITFLPSACGGHYRLYMALDIHGRKIVGWAVHERESAELAAEMVARACEVEGVLPGRLTLHSDNGAAMRGSAMLAMLDALVVASSFSRPASSNGTPHVESLFRALKHSHLWPSRPFASLGAARAWVRRFVDFHNTRQRHGEIGDVTPHQRHSGEDAAVLARRQSVWDRARAAHPERWHGRAARAHRPAAEVWLNRPVGRGAASGGGAAGGG